VIDYAGALFLVIGFIVILKIAGLVERSTRVIAISKQAIAVLRDEGMSDDEKESLMQGHAKQLAGLFFFLTIGGLAAVFLPFALILVFDQAGWLSVDSVVEVALSWPFITATTVVIVIAVIVSRKR
jgi:hypothetical protein